MCYTFDLEGRYRRKSRWLEVPVKKEGVLSDRIGHDPTM
jgi:hypothetical protein